MLLDDAGGHAVVGRVLYDVGLLEDAGVSSVLSPVRVRLGF